MIDSHAHLTDERLLPEADEVVARARAAGVTAVVSIGTQLDDSREALELARRIPGVFATAGIHPHNAEQGGADAMAEVRRLAAFPQVVALGETGLDYHYDHAPRALQQDSLLRHLELGRELDLPVVVHCRDADDDLRAVLAEAGRATRGVLHCFAGDAPLLEVALELGWYVSFSGMVTFKNYGSADLLRRVPEDRLLVETDSPYLAPVPHRGKRNEPAHVALVARRAAELRGADPDALGGLTARNARELYRLDTAAGAAGAVPVPHP